MSGAYYFPEIMGSGGALVDYDRDGDLDVFLVQGVEFPSHDPAGPMTTAPPVEPGDRLFRNELHPTGQLTFTDVTDEAGIAGVSYGMGVAVGDYDLDGWPDLYVTNFGSNVLWRNDGDGSFTDVTVTAHVDDSRWSASAIFADYDGDGWPDLFVINYVSFTIAGNKQCFNFRSTLDYCGPSSYRPQPDSLFRNRGDGTFEDRTPQSQIGRESGAGLGVVAEDLNNDGHVDFYVANDGTPNRMWVNRGDGTFRDDALIAGCALNEDGVAEASMGVDVADFDGDGDPDLVMTHLEDETHTVYVNDGNGWFADRSNEIEIGTPTKHATGFGARWIDFDNDGWLDLFVANGGVRAVADRDLGQDPYPYDQKNQLFRNLAGVRFEEAELHETEPRVGRGAAFGDIDNDGDTDILVCNNSGPAELWVNRVGQDAEWLGLRLVEGDADGTATGARVEAVLVDGPPLHRAVRSAASYLSSSDPRVLLGLNGRSRLREIRVTWPDGVEERWDAPSTRQYVTLKKGTGSREP
ncbi:MAG: CRTAC1 family protein [Acidobacteriota bacterium]|nr:CRTAC1 family protein [Acidobacteriota bacterium]